MTDALEGQIPRRPAAPQLRIGTAERDAATDELRRHMIDGRLEAEELQERLQGVYGAKTYGDLATLMHDLPPLRPVDRGPVSPAPQVGADTGRPRPGRPSHPAHSALRWWLVGPWVSVNALMVLIWAVSGGGYFSMTASMAAHSGVAALVPPMLVHSPPW
jgi:hypothetical protein